MSKLALFISGAAMATATQAQLSLDANVERLVAQELLLCVSGERLTADPPFYQTREVKVRVRPIPLPAKGVDGLLTLWLRAKVWPEATVDRVTYREITDASECAASEGNLVVLDAEFTQGDTDRAADIRGDESQILQWVRDGVRVAMRSAGLSTAAPRLVTVPVFYATPRAQLAGSTVASAFGEGVGPSLVFGKTTVGVPHQGAMDRTLTSVATKVEQVTAIGTMTVADSTVVPKGKEAWVREIETLARRDPDRGVLIFVHGYRTNFQGAVGRAGQLLYDLYWPGAVVAYAWPSHDALLRYRDDVDVAKQSVDGLAAVIAELALLPPDATGRPIKVSIVGHSMGNRVLLPALKLVLPKLPLHGTPLQVVMAAPDVPRDWFNMEFDIFLSSSRAVTLTLYGNSNDRALGLAPHVQGLERLGLGMPYLIERGYMDAIDASGIANEFFGLNHSYFADKLNVLSDMHRLLRLGEDAATRTRKTLKPIPIRRRGYEVR